MNSVTEVLDYSCPPHLVKWFKNNSAAKCDKVGKETSECGTLVDGLIQQDIREGSYVSPLNNPDALNCLSQWEQLKKDHPEFVKSVSEMQAEVKAFGVIGHPDFINRSETEWGITDLKCTSGIRGKNWIQCAQYARMLMDERGAKFPDFIRVIRLPRDGSPYEYLEIRDPRMIKKLMWMFDSYLGVFLSDKVINEHFRQQNENNILGDC